MAAGDDTDVSAGVCLQGPLTRLLFDPPPPPPLSLGPWAAEVGMQLLSSEVLYFIYYKNDQRTKVG